MEVKLDLRIQPQPDEVTCGPTCLHAVYQYLGLGLSLEQVIAEVPMLEGGGTLSVSLGSHALRKGFRARIYSYNVQVFDPTWFDLSRREIIGKLKQQIATREDEKLKLASEEYIKFLELGGQLRFDNLNRGLVRHYLNQGVPILTGLSATYLYRCAREFGPNLDYDDIRGEPSGHFVVLCGYDRNSRLVQVADPLSPNPAFQNEQRYAIDIDRVICAILLGILTYDANLLIIRPK
ncbi:MAG: C39 family peptidase [Verrucomicrobiales bacterium]|nr:C39 family peptidase [Verrucomicrobiales bacterium]